MPMTAIVGKTARGSIWRAPAEEAPHRRTWMAWPATPSIYGGPGAYYEGVQSALGRLARAIADHEPVAMAAAAEHHPLAAELCGPKVRLVDIPTDDMWARDSGPVFVHGGEGILAAIDFNFNGWGNKQTHAKDGMLAARIGAHLGIETVTAPICGEGGGLEYDGEGTLLLTESCWVNDNRNPGMSRDDIEAALKSLLGVAKVIWLPGVRGQEITDGHIDGAIRFVRPGVILADAHVDSGSVWGAAQREALEILKRSSDFRGRGFDIHSLEAATQVRSRRANFFSSYLNFYIGNRALYTPQFGDRNADAAAVATFERLFPGREIVQLEVDAIYENGGGIHCVTQQEPLR